jgi:predicted Zn-ribbon and HTH transcriptional regulator
MYKVQEIFNKGYGNFLEKHGENHDTDKAAKAIMSCKTSALGGNSTTCQDCGETHVHYNSCRNRHCPCCQSLTKEKWIDARKADVVDAPYFHAVFTVPEDLNPIIFSNKRQLYNLLYSASSDTLIELARDKRHMGADIGFLSILHTWGSNLSFHPHIHVIVLGGGLDKSFKFITKDKKFLFPIKIVSRLFRGKFLSGLKKLKSDGKLTFPVSLSILKQPEKFNGFLSNLYSTEWVPHIKETFKGAANVIEYLGRYTHRIAISNSRITDVGETSVTFKVKDYKSGSNTELTLSNEEFIRRFLMHVLPKGFVKIRHYGILSNRTKRKKVAIIRALIGGRVYKPIYKDLSGLQLLKKMFSIDPGVCRYCGSSNIRRESLNGVKKLE